MRERNAKCIVLWSFMQNVEDEGDLASGRRREKIKKKLDKEEEMERQRENRNKELYVGSCVVENCGSSALKGNCTDIYLTT